MTEDHASLARNDHHHGNEKTKIRPIVVKAAIACLVIPGVISCSQPPASDSGGLHEGHEHPDDMPIAPSLGDATDGQLNWYRGQLHVHANYGIEDLCSQCSTISYGTVLDWYFTNEFNFVALTDLNYYKPVDGLEFWNTAERFLLLAGTELNTNPFGGEKIVDSLGIGTTRAVNPPSDSLTSVSEILDEQARRIRSAGGLAVVAHPNLSWSVTAQDILAIDTVAGTLRDPLFFEVMNGEPGMNNMGGGGFPSTEEIWDEVLTAGKVMYGIGADDSHQFERFGVQFANPGRAWVVVRAPSLAQNELFSAMKAGDFYATTGLELLDYQVDDTGIDIALNPETRDLGWSVPGTNDQRYRTEFIGSGGQVLHVDDTLDPSYVFQGDELYVRARITSSDGLKAWTQPVYP